MINTRLTNLLPLFLTIAGIPPANARTALERQYESCLKNEILKHRLVERLPPQQEVEFAAKACREIAPEFAEDIRMGILECGVEPDDASPDMGCESDVVARPPSASPDGGNVK